MIAPPPRGSLTPRPAGGRAGGRHGPGSRAWARPTVLLVIIFAVAAILGACAPTPSSTPFPSERPGSPALATPPGGAAGPDLLLLADAEGHRTLSLLRLSGDVVPLPVPDPSTVAVTPMPDGGLVALLADGRAFLAPRGAAGLVAGDGWRPLPLAASGSLPPGTFIAFGATLAPDGTTLAAIARPPDAEMPGSLVLVDPGRGRSEILALPGQLAGTPPAWVDEARVAVVGRDRHDRTELVIVEAASGTIVDRIPMRALDVRTSGDTRTAVVLGDGGSLLVGSTAALLERRAAPAGGPATPAGDAVRGGLALDEAGRRLAAVVDEGDDGPARVAVYELDGATWRAAARLTPPAGTRGGTVAWLR